MNVLVISGGSGNDALIKGLVRVYPDVNIKVLLNAYDNGKSTGICRHVTNTLGVSDIRKNHIRMYKERIPQANWNQDIIDFYSKRFDLTPGKELEEVIEHLLEWRLDDLCFYAERFFARPKASVEHYVDFSISNIIYSEMYAELGYEETNDYFAEEILGIDNFVVFNSYDQVFIDAVTKNGMTLNGEETIVDYNNEDDPIEKIIYNIDKDFTLSPTITLNAKKAIDWADLIVISSGTFWASIYPTLEYADLYKLINNSRAKKVWVMNNEPDKDCLGVSDTQLIQHFENLGLDLSDFTILYNYDGNKLLNTPISAIDSTFKYDYICESMGNHEGKHNPILLANVVYKIYYNLTSGYDNIFFDFDDTIWPRNNMFDHVGRDNIRLLSKFKKDVVIVSGNTMESVRKHIEESIGDLDSFFADVWADANTTKMYRGKIVETLDELTLPEGVEDIIKELETYNVKPVAMRAGSQNITCIKIKPLHKRERVILLDLLNKYLIPLYCKDMNVVARSTGTTTIDIMNQNNDKLVVFHKYSKGLEGYGNFLYIGDEVDSGNDINIALACNNSIHVKDVKETNLILRLLTSNL